MAETNSLLNCRPLKMSIRSNRIPTAIKEIIMPTYIKRETGEFGEMYTWAFMYHEVSYNVNSLLNEFTESITPVKQRDYEVTFTRKRCTVSNLKYKDIQVAEELFKQFLIKHGFKDLFDVATEVTFSD